MSKAWRKGLVKSYDDVIYNIIDRTVFRTVTDCWEWMGSTTSDGHGRIRNNGEHVYVHRIMFEWFNGNKITQKILHKCDNAKCWNPSHLYEGSDADNVRDRVARKRSCVKLTDSQVEEIRNIYLSKAKNQQDLAISFNVHQSTINGIVNNKTRRIS